MDSVPLLNDCTHLERLVSQPIPGDPGLSPVLQLLSCECWSVKAVRHTSKNLDLNTHSSARNHSQRVNESTSL
jgi:hypothetical protein